MLTFLGRLIEKRPWFVVIVIIIITIGFSSTLPSLEFKTDFKDFMPDEDLVRANTKVQDYFGISQLPMFILVEGKQSENVISAQAIKEIYFIENEVKIFQR